ncbi:MazG-like family protein [Streptomyces achromogenes]|uniref:MazG-like family protein n=1 Tax=Streptomyces achromogenes TaxID=67255 RepID=UPI0033DD0078
MGIPDGHIPSNAPPWDDIGRLAALFTSLDTERGITPEQQWTLQVLKISEEAGETAQAVIGAWGTNPRKGRSHTWRHVQEEVADTAITSLVSLYRMLGEEAPAFFAAVLAEKSAKFLAFEEAGDQRHGAPCAATADQGEGG